MSSQENLTEVLPQIEMSKDCVRRDGKCAFGGSVMALKRVSK